jgi:hypothetical protein
MGAVVLAWLLAAGALSAAGAALAVGQAAAAPESASYFVMVGGAGNCAQATPCQLPTALGLAVTGDSVYVGHGVYTGTGAAVVTLTRSIRLQGGWTGNPSGPPIINLRTGASTLDGQASRRGVYVSSGLTPTISGLEITQGNATGLTAGCLGDSAKGCGGGMFVDKAAAVIENNTFLNNTALVTATSYGQGHGGGLYLETAAGSVISHNVFISNTGALEGENLQGNGGGLEVHGPNTDTIVANNQFIGNLAAEWGGGLALEEVTGVQVQGNTFQDNAAVSGGGLYGWYNSLGVLNNVFRGNSGDGAAYLGFFSGPFANNLIVDNPSVAGIVVAYGDGGLPILYNNIVSQPGAGQGFDVFAGASHRLELFAINNTLVGPGAGTGVLVASGYVTLTAANTLLSGFSTGIMSLHPASVTVSADYTLFDENVGALGNAAFTHNVFGAPAFVDPAGRDYHILANSAARDTGLSTLVSTDIDGDHRPIGPANDIGADETRFVTAVFLPLSRR